MTGLVNMSQQFQGLPMGDLIGAPLGAACDAQVKLAQSTADFIRTVGFVEKEGGGSETRTADFSFKRPVINPDGTLLCHQAYGLDGVLIADLDLTLATGLLARRLEAC